MVDVVGVLLTEFGSSSSVSESVSSIVMSHSDSESEALSYRFEGVCVVGHWGRFVVDGLCEINVSRRLLLQ
jgi:hypothetical protein